MKRLHLFEVEDLAACPDWIRDCVTAMIVVVHRWFGVPRLMAKHLEPILADFQGETEVTIVDTCSGNGGPMIDAVELLVANETTDRSLRLLLSDKRPPSGLVTRLNQDDSKIQYVDRPVDVCMPLMKQLGAEYAVHSFNMTSVKASPVIRTLVCGFHHLAPEEARLVLLDAQQAKQPLVIFELTKGTVPPRWLWWITLLPNFLFGLLVSLFVRPISVRSVVFSFLLPIVPACFAWDGAVTSARTYRESEFQAMLETIPESSNYQWQFIAEPGAVVEYSMIIGRPVE